jgi:hypothetical protein
MNLWCVKEVNILFVHTTPMKTVAKVTRQTLLLVYLLIFMPLHRRWSFKIVSTPCMNVLQIFEKNHNIHAYSNLQCRSVPIGTASCDPQPEPIFFDNMPFGILALFEFYSNIEAYPPWA